MKKLYSFLAALFVCVAANAQLYLCGTGSVNGTSLGWDPASALQVTAATDGTYTFTVVGATSIKMSTTGGEDWDAFNAGSVGVYNVEVGMNELITEDFDNLANTEFPWLGDWTVKVNLTAKTLEASTTTPKPTSVKLYLVGSITGLPEAWGEGFIDSHELKTTDGALYTLEGVQFAMNDEFKIAGQGWSPNIGAAGSNNAVYPGQVMTLEKGSNPGNLKVMVPYTGLVSYNFETNDFVLGSLAGIDSVEAETVAPVYYNLQGVRVENAENGVFIEVRGNKVAKVIK